MNNPDLPGCPRPCNGSLHNVHGCESRDIRFNCLYDSVVPHNQKYEIKYLKEQIADLKEDNRFLMAICKDIKKELGYLCQNCHWQDYTVGPRNPEPCSTCFVEKACAVSKNE